MTAAPEFRARVSMTHIGTATSILSIDGVNFITDPMFLEAGTHSQGDLGFPPLTVDRGPALTLEQLPHIDCVLLSHEDHIDNLDDQGRILLNGRHVLTTMDGAKNLAPRPSVQGKEAWESTTLRLQGKDFKFTWTPAVHLPGGECTGFMIEYEGFGTAPDGRPNTIWFSGDTVYHDGLKTLGDKFNIVGAIVNLGEAKVPAALLEMLPEAVRPNLPEGGSLAITMGGKDCADFIRDAQPAKVIPLHFAEWKHFTQFEKELRATLEDEGVIDRFQWLEPAVETVIFCGSEIDPKAHVQD